MTIGGGGGDGKYLIVKDKDGVISEILAYKFESNVIKGERVVDSTDLINNLVKLGNNKKLEFKYCLHAGYETFYKTKSHHILHSRYIEVRLVKFINDLKLNNQIEISEIGWKEREDGIKHTCAQVSFNTTDAYLLADYYFATWNLPPQREFKPLQPFTKFNFNQLKALTTDQLLKYKRD